MERNQAISVAVGVGAVGTALAYLGYSYYANNKSDTDNLVGAKKSSFFDFWSNSNTNETEEVPENNEKVENEEPKEQEMKVIKKDEEGNDTTSTTNDVNVTTTDEVTGWGQFWKKQYKEQNVQEQNVQEDKAEE